MAPATGEHSPLLTKDSTNTSIRASHSHDDEERASTTDGPPKPFKLQIFALCCAAITEPVACFCIFPFISAMIARNGMLDDSDVGFWAGAIESLFSVVQMGLMFVYGRLSDRYGRKPVLVFSLAGLSISTALFGLGRTLWQMILLRCLAGSFSGNALTVRVMVAESCNKSNERKAFAWFMFARNFGILLGPVLGGAFADPQFTQGSRVFERYPFLLATLVTGGVCLFGTLLVAGFCHETFTNESTEPGMETDTSMPVLKLLRSPQVAMALFVFGYTMFLALANTAVLPVFLFTRVSKGGLGFSPRGISYFLAGLAASQGLWTLLCFPSLQQRLGTRNVMRVCSCGWPILFISSLALNEILRRGQTIAFWCIVPIPLVVGGAVAMSFAGAQMLVNDSAPSPRELGSVNALTQTLNSAIRAVTPPIFTSAFAIGTKTQWIDGHLCWAIMITLTLPLQLVLMRQPKTMAT